MILTLIAFCFQVTTGGVQTPAHAENVEVTDAWPPVADAVNDPEIRRQFILREIRIKEGMTRRQVRQILGEPDEIVAGSGSPNEFWNYGTAGPGTMPVLGVVRFNPDGKVYSRRYRRPRATPPPV